MKQLMKLFVAGAAVAGISIQAHAELPAGVNTAITSAGTDAATVGGLVLVVIIGIAAFKYIRRAL